MSDTRVDWHDTAARRAADEGGERGLDRAAERLRQAANSRAPLDVGTLIGSARVDVQDGEAVVSYDTVYAARLHAHPEYEFQNGRRGKWLEQAAEEGASDVMEDIAAGVREVMR